MKPRFVLSPEAALDLVAVWQYITQQSSIEMADHVEAVIWERIVFLARNPRAGHVRKDLTDIPVRFFPVYSYLINLSTGDKASADCCYLARSPRRPKGTQGPTVLNAGRSRESQALCNYELSRLFGSSIQ